MAQKTYTLDIDVNAPSIGQLESQLEQVNSELKNLDRNSDAFKQAAKDAQALNAQLEKTNNEIAGLKLEDKLQAADGAIKVLGGSLSSVVGTLGLLGVESEVFGEFEEKAASAIAVGMGIKDVSEGFGQFMAVMKKSGIAATLFGNITKKALISTGIGAFVVALGTVVAYWDDIVAAVDSSSDSVEDLNKELEDTKTLSQGTTSVLESQKALLEARGESTMAINKALVAELETQIGITEQMILQKQLQLEEKQADNAKISWWEAMKIQAAGYFGLYKTQAKQIAEATNADDEETLQLKTEISEAEANLNNLKTKQVGVQQELNTQMEMAAGPVEKLTVATQGVVLASQDYGAQIKANTAEFDGPYLASLAKTRKAEADAAKVKADAIAIEEGRTAALGASANALQALGGVLEQESAGAKALAISSALINTYLGVTEVLKQKSTLPSPFDVIVKVANVATILATGLAAVKNIKATPAKGGGGASMGSPRGATTSAAAPQQPPRFDAPQTLTATPTVKAYVLSGDVRSTQEADAKLNARRTLA